MYVHNTSRRAKLLANYTGMQSWRRGPAQLPGNYSCHEQELFLHKHDHNASWCDQAWKHLKNRHDAISSKHVDENESITPPGVQEFFCSVDFVSFQDQNHYPANPQTRYLIPTITSSLTVNGNQASNMTRNR